MTAGARVELPLGAEPAAMVCVFEGAARVGEARVEEGQLALLGEGDAVALSGDPEARLLLLAGVPLREPFVRYGPFVMNTEGGIRQAMIDDQLGRMGRIAG